MLDPSYLLVGLIISSIGLGYVIYGRKQKHKVAFYAGICLILCPYLLTDIVPMIILSVAIILVPKYVRF